MGGGETVWGEARLRWRQASPFGGVVTVLIKLKPKGAKGQVLRTCRSSLDCEQSRRRLDRRRRRTGWRRKSLCCSPPVPRPAALQALAQAAEAEGPQRRLCRRPPPAPGAAAGDAGGGGGRAIATGCEVQLAQLPPLQICCCGGPLPAPRRAPATLAEVGLLQRAARCSWRSFRQCNGQ